MAKKIRQIKNTKRSKLVEEDIHKNNGKEISHTISKIKEHETLYTFLLVIIFMVTISLSVFLGLSVDKYQLYDASYYSSSFSMRGQLVTLSSHNIMSDEDGLNSSPYTLEYTNNTNKHINYLLRFSLDEDAVERCRCSDKITSFQNIHFSLDGETVQQFSDESMIITAGMLGARKSDEVKIYLWLDDSLKDSDCYYFGKFIFEELEDMDS